MRALALLHVPVWKSGITRPFNTIFRRHLNGSRAFFGAAGEHAIGGFLIPYGLTIEARPTYLHAKVVGDRTPENSLRFLEEVFAACVKNGHSMTLLEMQLSGPSLNTADIFRVISQRSLDGVKLRRIAYVEASVSDLSRARFAETVAINRAVNVRLFKDVAEAARWLEAE